MDWAGRGTHLIHCGSSVTTSPGVTMAELVVLRRLEGRVSSMDVSPSESWEASLSLLWVSGSGLAGAGAMIVKGIMAGCAAGEQIVLTSCQSRCEGRNRKKEPCILLSPANRHNLRSDVLRFFL